MNNLIIDVNDLGHNELQNKKIRKEIFTLCKIINDEIKNNSSIGKTKVFVDIPTLYNIPDMTNKESQVIILSEVIKMLKEKNYYVKVHVEEKITLEINFSRRKLIHSSYEVRKKIINDCM